MTFIFRGKEVILQDPLTLKTKALQSFKMSGTTYLTTKHNISENLNIKTFI
jgi:hypothetical protein